MDKNRFNKEVRPYVPEIKIGTQGVAFDRLDLDAWFDDYKSRVGSPASQKQEKFSCPKKTPGLTKRNDIWHINKVIKGKRLYESTGTSNLEEAERFLAKRINEFQWTIDLW
jgi:uncharacterized protein YdiU (UPF0061 family)